MFEKSLLKILGNTEYGKLELSTPKEKTYVFEGQQPGPNAHIKIKDWRTVRHVILKGSIGVMEAYRDDLWESNDVPELLSFFIKNEKALRSFYYGKPPFYLFERLKYLFRLNSLSGAKRNIHAHYDLGNDFYALWLDPSMTYSSALFGGETRSLEAAQLNKYQRVLSLLEKNSGRLLEIGCGWGSFIKQALDKHDFSVKGITLSKAQQIYAQHKLDQRAEIALEDYREQKDTYDHIVSIEMIEAVGERYWPIYFRKIAALLSDKGQAVIQAITIHDDLFKDYRSSGDAIRSFIFPGGMLFSPSRFYQEAQRAGLAITDKFEFGQDYAKTLKCWLANFDKKQKEIIALGFSKSFIRIWRLYLAMCIAGFETKRTNVMQVRLAHAS